MRKRLYLTILRHMGSTSLSTISGDITGTGDCAAAQRSFEEPTDHPTVIAIGRLLLILAPSTFVHVREGLGDACCTHVDPAWSFQYLKIDTAGSRFPDGALLAEN
jgi:hypothetical protein